MSTTVTFHNAITKGVTFLEGPQIKKIMPGLWYSTMALQLLSTANLSYFAIGFLGGCVFKDAARNAKDGIKNKSTTFINKTFFPYLKNQKKHLYKKIAIVTGSIIGTFIIGKKLLSNAQFLALAQGFLIAAPAKAKEIINIVEYVSKKSEIPEVVKNFNKFSEKVNKNASNVIYKLTVQVSSSASHSSQETLKK